MIKEICSIGVQWIIAFVLLFVILILAIRQNSRNSDALEREIQQRIYCATEYRDQQTIVVNDLCYGYLGPADKKEHQ